MNAPAASIMPLFREWEQTYRQAGNLSFAEEVASGMFDRCRALEQQMMSLRAKEADELAAKLIVITAYGDFVPSNELIDEAKTLVATIAKPVEIGDLVSAHINAVAEFERQHNLNDWGLSGTDDTVSGALAAANQALLEICKARPTDPEDIELRRLYLSEKASRAIEGVSGGYQQEVINALIGGAS